MKILILTKYTRMAASSRVRSYQYMPYYQAAGITCTISPLFSDVYLQRLYAKQKIGMATIAACYIKRIGVLLNAKKYDLLIIEKELFPYMTALAEKLLKWRKVPYIVDYDDAIFHNYDIHPSGLIRKLLGNKIPAVMRNAVAVVAGNDYIAAFAAKAKAVNVSIIPTVINTDVYQPGPTVNNHTVVIGWIGSPTTLKYLQKLLPVFTKLIEKCKFQLHIVGGLSGIGFNGHETVLTWSESEEVNLIRQFDIGIMPLEDSLWEKGKCGYKLIQYMGCAIPVVGSPVGVNDKIIQHGVNGYKAANEEEWLYYLEKLITGGDSRLAFGQAGRKLVEEEYSISSAFKKWLKLVNSSR